MVEKVHIIPKRIDNSFILMMDVLKHIKDDYAILKNINDRLGENSY